jgi:DNA-binding ferritin-like protein (Dps family)
VFKTITAKLKDLRRQKKMYKDCVRRSKALPHDYREVYKIASYYMLNFSSSDSGVINLFPEMLDMFELGAAEGRDVLELVGNDVMAFCDGLLEGVSAQTWTGKMRAKMNDSIHKKLGR